nr:hypothetical protein [Tanacetum cinerariifolium]
MAPKKRTTRASLATKTTTTTPVTNAQLKELIDQGVADAVAAHDADRSMNGDDNHNSGTGVRRQAHLARECTYPDFMKCKPLYFKGTEGVVELTKWFERIETTSLEKKTTDKYCPRGEIKKMEVEMWNMKVKGIDVVSYNQRFQKLALMCARMFPEESNKIEKYVGGLPDIIYGSVMASKPKTMQDAVEFATELMDKKIPTFAERQTKIKSKQDDNQQQENKRQNTGRANTAALERRSHIGDLSNYALNATITAMVQVLPNATSTTELAIWPVTVGVLLLLTIRETSLAMNVGIKGTKRVIA